ncbi:MAG: transposase [Elusimicrobiota bacterium]|nr:transposase [Elusimicrobiota bacterium]
MFNRFTKYLVRMWGFEKYLVQLKDNRSFRQIPTSNIWLSIVGMFATRLASINELEQHLQIPFRWERLIGERKPTADSIAYCLDRFNINILRNILADIGCKFKRKKIFKRTYPDVHWVAAIDGIEIYKSRKRCCSKCCSREIPVKDGTVTEYYHRYVALQMVGVIPALILDIEQVRKGETEVAAGVRMLKRFKKKMPRFIDVITLDALYLQAPFVREVLKLGYGLVIVLKQENRELYRDADKLFQITPSVKSTDSATTISIQDIEGLTSWKQLDGSTRVVRSFEKKTKRERIAGKWTEREIKEDWRWTVIFPDNSKPPADLVKQWGHARWDEETRGFGELTQYWNLNHCYRHHPNAMLALLITLFITFALTTVFFQRNLKSPMRIGKTRLHLARLLNDDFVFPGIKSFWPCPP